MNNSFDLTSLLAANLPAEKTPNGAIVTAENVSLELPAKPLRFYRHGWQSWSPAAWTDLTPLPIQKPYILHPLQIDPAYAKETRPHGSWVGAVKFEDENVLLLGSLGLGAHVVLNRNRLEGKYESGNGGWFITHGREDAVFSSYARELGKRFGTKTNKPAPRVWCSWYSLYTAIDEKLLCRIFDDLGDLPFDILQVDDGWQISVGDWEANSKFSSGMSALAEKIKSTGRKAGLWLAPLIAVKSSKLFREHPDWFLRGEGGRYVSAGFNWGEQLYALDTTHPSALEWLTALMKRVRAWGFDYLKLDFLYAGALPGRRRQDILREAAYRQGLEAMRKAMGDDAYFLACGAPILPSLGLCNALRVGPDVAAEWESKRDILLYNLATPGTRNAIRTTVHRLWLSPLVQPDPDVVYFRARECSLNAGQKSMLQDLASVCGFKATSDLPQWLRRGEREDLRKFLEARPKVKQISSYVFQLDKRTVDFGPAMPLPETAKGFDVIQAAVIGWLGNQGWALNMLNKMQNSALKKLTSKLSGESSNT
jgi:alpha-galactosidase